MDVASTVSVLPPTLIDGALKNHARPRRRPNAWISSSRCTRPHLQRPRTAPEASAEVGHRVVERPRHHLGPGCEPLEESVVAELPALDQERGEPAHDVARILEDGMGEVDTGEDPPRVAADGLSECSASRAMNAS